MSREKLELINKLTVVESEGSGGELYYVYAEKTDEAVEILKQLGVPDSEIDEMTDTDGGLIDISRFGFTYAGAKWFEGGIGFIDYVPDDAPDWAK